MVPPIVRRFTLGPSPYPTFMPCVGGFAPSTLLAQPMEREKLPRDSLHGLGTRIRLHINCLYEPADSHVHGWGWFLAWEFIASFAPSLPLITRSGLTSTLPLVITRRAKVQGGFPHRTCWRVCLTLGASALRVPRVRVQYVRPFERDLPNGLGSFLFFIFQEQTTQGSHPSIYADLEQEQGDLSTTTPFRPCARVDNVSGVEIYCASNE
ncbi:hypothetical protein VNO77_03761 [Canavalia gladiata]|uniref:Uncharacterized protein n=1 Tax=Canavalia gladiata TaxID=3824 RepID=A0AAN9N0G1_CANGL